MTFFSLIEIGKIARNTLKHNSDYINYISLCLFFTSNIHTYVPHTILRIHTRSRIHTRTSHIHSLSLFLFHSLCLSQLLFAPCPYHSFDLRFRYIQHTVTVIHIYRAEWPYAISIVRLAEACTNVSCATKGIGQ